jgi:hypothetical protein
VPGIPKYSAEDTSLVVGNEAGETIVVPIPAGSPVKIDVPGLHYNRKSHLVQRLYPSGLQRVMQHDIGKTHMLSSQRGFWANGIKTRLFRSLVARGRASDAGNPLSIQFKAEVSYRPEIQVFREDGVGHAHDSHSTLQGGTTPQICWGIV